MNSKIYTQPVNYFFLSISLLCLLLAACKNNDDDVVLEMEEPEVMEEYIRIELDFNETYGDEFFNLPTTAITGVNAVVPGVDGGFLFTGSNPEGHATVLKIDESCNYEWLSSFDLPYNVYAYDIIQTIDDGYLVIGIQLNTTQIPNEIFAIKINDTGEEVWRRSYGAGVDQWPGIVHPLENGDFLIVGMTEPNNSSDNVLMIRIDENGQERWRKEEDMGSTNRPTVFIPMGKDDFWIMGTLGFLGAAESIYIINIDGEGNILSNKTIPLSNNLAGNLSYVLEENGILLSSTGYDPEDQLGKDLLLMKIDFDGEVIWSKNYGGPSVDSGGRIIKTPDGNYLVTGSYGIPDNGYNDIFLLKIDATGNKIWAKSYGAEHSDRGGIILPIASGGYLITGSQNETTGTDSEMVIFKVDEDGVPF